MEELWVQVEVVEWTQQVAVQEQEIAHQEKEMEARIWNPLEAESYRLEGLGQAEKPPLIQQAEAEAEFVWMREEVKDFAPVAGAPGGG